MVTQTSGDETRSSRSPQAAPKKVARSASGRARSGPPLPSRIARFFREVVAELRKVIWPTRKELVTYTVVVIVFVSVIVAIVAGLDFGFAKAALAVFGGGQ